MIKLSNKWWYALKAVLFVAKNKWNIVKIKEISGSQYISETLLRRIIADLERHWVLKTFKWRNGGVVLWKELNRLSVYDVLLAVWEELGITDCTKGLECDRQHDCSTTNLLWNMQKSFNGILKLQTLDKIVK
jgi:Rrf2 family protein